MTFICARGECQIKLINISILLYEDYTHMQMHLLTYMVVPYLVHAEKIWLL